MRKERRIDLTTEHFGTDDTESRLPSDLSVDFGDGHVMDVGREGLDDPIAHANDTHNKEHGGTGKEGIQSLTKEDAMRTLNNIVSTMKKLRGKG